MRRRRRPTRRGLSSGEAHGATCRAGKTYGDATMTETTETLDEFERRFTVRAQKMTLDEIDNGLVALPTAPETDHDLIARCVLARRRGELVNAGRPDPLAPSDLGGGLVEVIVPDGGASCVMSRTK